MAKAEKAAKKKTKKAKKKAKRRRRYQYSLTDNASHGDCVQRFSFYCLSFFKELITISSDSTVVD